MAKENILDYQSNIKTSRNKDSVYAMKYASQQMLIDKLEQQCQKQKEVIDKIEKYIGKQTRMYGLSMPIELGTHLDNILGILKEVSE